MQLRLRSVQCGEEGWLLSQREAPGFYAASWCLRVMGGVRPGAVPAAHPRPMATKAPSVSPADGGRMDRRDKKCN